METKALALRGQSVISTMDDVERAATAMAKSGYFTDSRDMAQAVVKILAGQEMGFGPFASMTGVYIIQGRPSIGANLMAAAVKKSGRYNYRVVEMTEKNCAVEFFENGQSIGTSSFSIDEAKRAGTKNLDKYPRNMLFARAMSNGCRWYCPDVFNGSAVYTPEELGANVNEEGEVIDVPFTQAPQPTNGKAHEAPKAAPVEQPAPKMKRETAEAMTNSAGETYGSLSNEKLSGMSIGIGKALKKPGLVIADKELYQQKLDAIAAILYYRAEDEAAAMEAADDAARYDGVEHEA